MALLYADKIENVSVELFPEQETVHKSESSLTTTKQYYNFKGTKYKHQNQCN